MLITVTGKDETIYISINPMINKKEFKAITSLSKMYFNLKEVAVHRDIIYSVMLLIKYFNAVENMNV